MGLLGGGRGIGITEVLHGSVQDPLLVLFAVLTQLGDVWLLFVLGGVLYVAGDEFPRWGIERRRGLFVLGLVLTYVALIGVLKQLFLFPRPPGATLPPDVPWVPAILHGVFTDITTADGPGFPSGHALGTTMAWGGFALIVIKDRLSRSWLGVAGGVIGIVSLSRLVLGVHYLVDVVVGVVVGIVVLGVLYVIADRGTDPSRVLLAAVVIGAVGLVPGITFESVAAVGSAVGGWLVWRGIADSMPAHPTNRVEVVAGFAVLALAGGLFAALYALRPPLPLTFLGTALAVGSVVGAPLAGEKLISG